MQASLETEGCFQANPSVRPIHLYWTSVDGVGCTDEDARLMAGTLIIILTDLLVVFIPIPIIKSLQIPLQDKLVLGFLMCMGFL
jgi:hypothetical protein